MKCCNKIKKKFMKCTSHISFKHWADCGFVSGPIAGFFKRELHTTQLF